jgi:tight adherence protein C
MKRIKIVLQTLSRINEKINFPKDKYEKQLKETELDINVNEFFGMKELCSILFILIGIIIFESVIFGIILAIIGWILPDFYLKEKIKERKNKFIRLFPNFLDLLTAAVEAGLNFDAAVAKVIEVSKESLVKKEFSQFLYEIRIGKSRKDALKDMAKRVNIPFFTSFVSSVVQSEQLGVSLASSLRIQADEIRTKRRQLAEKLAMEAPVKLLFPLIVFIFPVTFIMIFGPLLLKFLYGF